MPVKKHPTRAVNLLTEAYQHFGLADALRKLSRVQHLLERGVLALRVQPTVALNGATDGWLLHLSDLTEEIAVGAALDHADMGLYFVNADSRSADEKAATLSEEDHAAAQERYVYGLVEQFVQRWRAFPDANSFRPTED